VCCQRSGMHNIERIDDVGRAMDATYNDKKAQLTQRERATAVHV